MSSTWIAIVLAILAIALAAFCLYKIYKGTFTQDQIEGIDTIKSDASNACVRSAANAANIDLINGQLGVISQETDGFSAVANDPIDPSFPLPLG
jgi:uncharacterized protein YpmB